MNLLIEFAKRFTTYPSFLNALITKNTIKDNAELVKSNGFKGLREFYKSVKRG